MTGRRFVGGLIRVFLVGLAIAIGFRWFHRRAPSRTHVRLESEAPPPDSLGPGDARLYNADSTADVILKGDKIMVGLSPKTVARVRTEMDKSREKDTSGLGGSIASHRPASTCFIARAPGAAASESPPEAPA